MNGKEQSMKRVSFRLYAWSVQSLSDDNSCVVVSHFPTGHQWLMTYKYDSIKPTLTPCSVHQNVPQETTDMLAQKLLQEIEYDKGNEHDNQA